MSRADEPLDLGVVGEPPPAEPPSSSPAASGGRWRWVALAAAVAVGAVLGVVVSGARHDAAELNDVGVVVGGLREWTGMSGQGERTSAGMQLLNVGEREIEILGFSAAGLSIAPGSPDPEPVTAPPGEWVVVEQQGLVPDCAADPPEYLDVRFLDAAGDERVVRAGDLPEYGLIATLWSSCRYGEQLFIDEPEVVTTDATSIVMDVTIMNDGREPATVHELGADSPGLRAQSAGLPVTVSPGDHVTLAVTWTVSACAEAQQFFDVYLTSTLTVEADPRDNPMDMYPVMGPARAELVRLVDRACESEG